MKKNNKTITIKIHQAMLNKNLEGDELTYSIITPMNPVKPPVWFQDWVDNQYKVDIKNINVRLDNIDIRLDQNGLAILDLGKRMDQNGLKPLQK